MALGKGIKFPFLVAVCALTFLAFCAPKPLSVVVSYSLSLSNAMSPFRATIAGTIHELGEVEPTNNGDLRRNFKLADDTSKWIHCVADGKHVESESLENMRRILADFYSGCPPLGNAPQSVWLFKGAFIVHWSVVMWHLCWNRWCGNSRFVLAVLLCVLYGCSCRSCT